MRDVERSARKPVARDNGKTAELERKLKTYENEIRKYKHHSDER